MVLSFMDPEQSTSFRLRPHARCPAKAGSEGPSPGGWKVGGRSAVLFHEREGDVRDFAPAAVDREGMAAAFHLDDLGQRGILLLQLVRGARDGPWNRVVLLARDDEKRAALRVRRVDLGFGPRVQVRGGGLEQRYTRARYRIRLVKIHRPRFAHGLC